MYTSKSSTQRTQPQKTTTQATAQPDKKRPKPISVYPKEGTSMGYLPGDALSPIIAKFTESPIRAAYDLLVPTVYCDTCNNEVNAATAAPNVSAAMEEGRMCKSCYAKKGKW